MRYESVVEARAQVDVAWGVLADLEAYGEWNPFLRRVAGQLAPGERLFVNAKPPRARGMLFHPVVVEVAPPRLLSFQGRLLVDGLFDGLYRFALVPLDGGRTRLDASLAFTGKLVPALVWKTGGHMREGLESMSEAWKERVERVAAGVVRPPADRLP